MHFLLLICFLLFWLQGILVFFFLIRTIKNKNYSVIISMKTYIEHK
jgi:hypothetical protein